SQDPWENIEAKYAVGTKHSARVRNFTNFGVFVEIEEGVDGLIHISDLSWTKKIKHPSEFTQIGATIEVVVLEIDKENRRLSLGHKQLEENPWNAFEAKYTADSVHEGKIQEISDKGAIVILDGVEGFAPTKQLVKEDGSSLKVGETAQFKVVEFSKSTKRITLSHTRLFDDAKRAEEKAERAAAKAEARQKDKDQVTVQMINAKMEKTTLGDVTGLSELKSQLEAKQE
ncbi:MAG: S1 RNA-binding domain-containing protein, partial [Rikenellaceae bacterium]|nr:S1 RNA-binding domain-containing protein [Rikenellaceae bacterium]